jgi:molecular chaperone GrpE
MSGDQDANNSSGDETMEDVIREAAAAVDQARGNDPVEIVDGPDLEAALEAAQAEAVALKDKWLRALADHENYKKRVKRDIDDAVHRAVQGLLGNFLPVGDNLERALSVVPSDVDEQLAPLIKGIEMVRQEFFSALSKQGITAIESVGRPFDPNVHDALQQQDTPDHAPGTVIMEYEKGYRRGEKLLRPARVIVAGPGSTGTRAEEGGEGESSG